jgi:hypothetical protein
MAKSAQKQSGTKKVRPKRRAEEEEAEEEQPKRPGFFRRFLGVVILLVVGAGGAFTWAFHKEHGEWPWDNPEKAKAFVSIKKDDAEGFFRDRGEDAEMLLAEGKKGAAVLFEKLSQEKVEMEEWFANQEIDLPSGQDLKDMAAKYLGPSEEEEGPSGEEAVPVTASPLPEVAVPVPEPEEKPAPKPEPKPVPKPEPAAVAKSDPAPAPKPESKPEPAAKPKPKPEPKPVEKEPETEAVVAMAETEVPSPKPYEKPPKPAAKPRPKPAARPGPAPAPANSPEAKGRALMKKGVKHWKESTIALQKGNRPKEQRELKASKQYFDKALRELTAASEKDPGNHKLQDLLVDCNRFRYDCLKRTILNVR